MHSRTPTIMGYPLLTSNCFRLVSQMNITSLKTKWLNKGWTSKLASNINQM